MNVNKETVLWGLAGMAGAYFLGKYIVKDASAEIGEAAGRVGQAINPTSDQNIFYKGVNSIGAALTGDDNFNLGSWTYDVLHPGEAQKLMGPIVINPKAPPEASVNGNFDYRVGDAARGTAPVTKGETGIIGTVTGWFE